MVDWVNIISFTFLIVYLLVIVNINGTEYMILNDMALYRNGKYMVTFCSGCSFYRMVMSGM